jgi:hypothetical protein
MRIVTDGSRRLVRAWASLVVVGTFALNYFVLGALAHSTEPAQPGNTLVVWAQKIKETGHQDFFLKVYQVNADNNEYDDYYFFVMSMRRKKDVEFHDIKINLKVQMTFCGYPDIQDHELREKEYKGADEHINVDIKLWDLDGNNLATMAWEHDWEGRMEVESYNTQRSSQYRTYFDFDWDPYNLQWDTDWFSSGISFRIPDLDTCYPYVYFHMYSKTCGWSWFGWTCWDDHAPDEDGEWRSLPDKNGAG